MPTQESKAHHVGEWASLRNTSPEIAEAIFEVAGMTKSWLSRFGKKATMKCWFAPSKKPTKTRCSGASKPSNVKTSECSPARAGVFFYFAALFITALNLSIGQKPLPSTGQPFSSSVTRCAGDCSDSTLALRNCSELW